MRTAVRPVVVYRVVGLAAALVVAGLLVRELMTLLLAAIVTIILALPLSEAASFGERRGVPRPVGALGAIVAGCAVLGGLGFAVIPEFVEQAKQFAARLPTVLNQADRYIHGIAGGKAHRLSNELSGVVEGYLHHPDRLIGPIEEIGLTVVALVIGLIVIVVSAFVIAVNPQPLVDGFMRLVPERDQAMAHDVLARVRIAWLGWMTAVGVDMLVLGSLLFGGMTLIGLNFAIGFAVFSAFMTVIPNYGSVISAVPPILDGLAQSPGKAVLVLVVYVIVNQIEGNLILPLIMARTVDMHPAVVTIGLLVMGALFGLIGVLIAIPLLSMTIILVQTLWIEPMEARAVPAEWGGGTTPTVGR